MLSDGLERPLSFLLAGGEKGDCQSDQPSLECQQVGAVLTGKSWLRA